MSGETHYGELSPEASVFADVTILLQDVPVSASELGSAARTRSLTEAERQQLALVYDRHGVTVADSVTLEAGVLMDAMTPSGQIAEGVEYATISLTRGAEVSSYLFSYEEGIVTGLKEVAGAGGSHIPSVEPDATAGREESDEMLLNAVQNFQGEPGALPEPGIIPQNEIEFLSEAMRLLASNPGSSAS